MTAPVERFADAEALARHAAAWFCETTAAAAGDGECAVCLSCGSTPRRLYELLAQAPLAARMPWRRIHWFFGDERFVPPDHPASNYRMVREALFSRAPVVADHVHPVPTERGTPAEAAQAYEQTLRDFGAAHVAPSGPLFAVTLLGLGTDGHTASLFPGQPALDETHRWVVAADGKPERVSLTFPALDSSAEVAFLVSGEAKRDILAGALRGDAMPATRVRPAGRLRWFADRAALPQAPVGAASSLPGGAT
jgi:6-phosphogluconolactonase